MTKNEIDAQLVMVKRVLRTVRTKRTKVCNDRQRPHNTREYDRLHGQEQAYCDVITYLKPMIEDLVNNSELAESLAESVEEVEKDMADDS